MVIRLPPHQVPMLWDAIKFAASKTAGISDSDLPLYLNRLLNSLLNSTAHCFVRLDDNRVLMAVAITRTIADEVTGEKSLFINCLYSFKGVDEKQWEDDIGIIKDFAIKQGCGKITTYTSSERVSEIAKANGFKERFRCFMLEV